MANLVRTLLDTPAMQDLYGGRVCTPLRDIIPRVGADYRDPVPPHPVPPRKTGAYGIAAGNAVGSIPVSRRLGDRFEAYDSLPPAVRQALQQAVVDQCPITIRSRYTPIADLVPDEDEAARLYVQCFHMAEEEEIERHSDLYRIQYRTLAPHVAAQASVLRADYRRRRVIRGAIRGQRR